MDDEPKPIVQVPEKEATELASKLRHSKELKGVALSVYGYVNPKGVRALHVAIDLPLGNDVRRYDIRYKADSDLDALRKNAVKRINSKLTVK